MRDDRDRDEQEGPEGPTFDGSTAAASPVSPAPGSDPNETVPHASGASSGTARVGQGLGPSPSRLAGRLIAGRFLLVDLLGKGGQAEVWRATQLSPIVRQVALKLMPPDCEFDRDRIDRFRKEAIRWAQVPGAAGILPIYEFGEEEGRPYIAMELIQGFHLGQVIVQRRERLAGSSPVGLHRLAVMPEGEYEKEAAKLVAWVARALQHAHDVRIVHRDVKPSNVLLDGADEAGVYLGDFGLARDLTDVTITPWSGVTGTPGYIAPEKLRGHSNVDEIRCDVYGLGVSLYEAATLERASTIPRDVPKTAWPVYLSGLEVRPPRAVRPGLSRDLEAVILKAIDENPSRRYPTAAAMADDLERFARDEPVQARPMSLARRLVRRLRRHPRALIAAGLLLATAIAYGGTTIVQRARAEVLWSRAERSWQDGRLADAARDVARAQALADGGAEGRALAAAVARDALDEAIEAGYTGNSELARSWWREWSAMSAAASSNERQWALAVATKPVRLSTDPPGALVNWRPVHPDGRPDTRGEPLRVDRAGSAAAPTTIDHLLADSYWVTAADPATGAFAERLVEIPWGLALTDAPPIALHLRLRPRGGSAVSIAASAGAPAMVPIPAGTVRLVGAPPAHPGFPVAAFLIDAREVTHRELLAYVDETADRELARRVWGESGRPDPEKLDWPATNVRHADAVGYAAWRGCRLPTEMELARAAATLGAAPPTAPGPEWSELHPAGSLAADRRGPAGGEVAGLASNASEWTQLRYRPARLTGYKLPPSNPRSTAWAGYAVTAGLVPRLGRDRAQLIAPTERTSMMPETASGWVGFRCARGLDPWSPENPPPKH